MMETVALPKPRLRGVSHQFAAFVALGAGLPLVALSPSPRAAVAAAVYAVTLTLMFATSAIYHRVDWTPAADARMRRLDHAAIFLIIAGTYTPFALLAVRGDAGPRLLALVWGGALLGILRAALWVDAPRAIAAGLYLALGWIALAFWPELRGAVDLASLVLVVAGGAFYSAGAVVYALRRPDPRPELFGYHEIFHAFTIAASLCHYAAVLRVIRAAG